MSTNTNNGEKQDMHLRNRNRKRYDLKAMIAADPELANYLKPDKRGVESFDFADPFAVKALNKAILIHYYGIKYWDFPKENLCPPIPGRAEYIHHVADLLGEYNNGSIPMGPRVTCLDIGMGASCIYPIIGIIEYDWNFIGSDIDPGSIRSAEEIVRSNPSLKGKVSCRIQPHPTHIFHGVIGENEKFDISICNPPFHASIEEASKVSIRKIKNLTGQKTSLPTRNFSGNVRELVYAGGEIQFIGNMISESKAFATSCLWFSTLVSKESNLQKVYKLLKKCNPTETRTINIKTGNKTSRIVAWTFLSPEEIKMWAEKRWT